MKQRGYVYVMSNRSYKGKVKIGKARNPIIRRKQLSGETGVLRPFRLEAYFKSDDYTADEQLAHLTLAQYRTKPNKEFFTLTPEAAIYELTKLFGPPKWCRGKTAAINEQRRQQDAQAQTLRLEQQRQLQQQRAEQLAALKAQRKHTALILKVIVSGVVLAFGVVI